MKSLIILSILAILLVQACASSKTSLNRRIDQNGTLFHQKSFSEKQAITNGNIVPGMTRDAVYLAWGDPKQRLEGVEDGLTYEEWIYEKYSPKPNFSIGVGSGPGVGLKKSTTKTVRFVEGRVTDYQKKL